MSLFGTSKAPVFTLSIALKSSSVDVQLISTNIEGKKEVLHSVRKIILLKDSQDPQTYTKQSLNELKTLLKSSLPEIQKITQGKIHTTRVILYAPWFTSKITPLTYSQKVVITEKFLIDQIKTIKPQKSLVTLEKKVIKILTNGYSLTELSRTKFDNVSIDIYSSYISSGIYKMIGDMLVSAIPSINTISYTTSPMMIFEQIKTYLVREDNVTFLYIGGEITEVGIIENDALCYFATFPLGKHDFLREIQGTISSYDYDLLYQKQTVFKSKKKQESFDTLKKQWATSVTDTLSAFKKNVPSKILIISDSKTRDFFTEQFSTYLREGTAPILAQHRIINFDISALKDILLYKTPTGEQELDLQLEALIKN